MGINRQEIVENSAEAGRRLKFKKMSKMAFMTARRLQFDLQKNKLAFYK